MKTKLERHKKECLNCGNKPHVGRWNLFGLPLYVMVCKTCGARLPLYSKSVNDAIKAWNQNIKKTVKGTYPAFMYGPAKIISMY